jgi:hypothetical protein
MSFSESSKQHEWNPYLRTESNFVFYFSETAVKFHLSWWFIISFPLQFKYCKYTLLAKGTGSRDRIQIVGQDCVILGLNKSLYQFLNFEDEPLMSRRLCHLYGRTFYVFDVAVKLLGGPPCYRTPLV